MISFLPRWLTTSYPFLSLFVFFLCVIQTQGLEFRSISGPPETSGSIDPGGVMVVGCTLQYPGKLDNSSSLYLVGTDGKRTQVSFSSLNSTTASQSYSTVPVPKDVRSGYYFLVAVDTNRTVIASSYNFQISGNIRDSSKPTTSGSPSSPSNPSTPGKAKNSDVGAVAGGIGGGLALVAFGFGFYFLRRRRRNARSYNPATDITEYFLEPTPFLSTSPSNVTTQTTVTGVSEMRERKMEMVGQRERLERQLENQGVTSGIGSDVPDLQRQVTDMTQRIAVLEAELAEQAPPEYASQYNP